MFVQGTAFWFRVTLLGIILPAKGGIEVFVFPITFASSAFVPTDGMPKYLRIFAENQPVTQVIEAIRALLVGTPVGDYGWKALAWCTAILVVSFAISVRLFRTRTPN